MVVSVHVQLDLRTTLEWNADAQHDMLRNATVRKSERTSSGRTEVGEILQKLC